MPVKTISADVLVVGGGVIGALTARELLKYRLTVCLAEKNADCCSETSKANSGIVHAGFDAPPGSNKAKFNSRGSGLMEETCRELDVKYQRRGAMVLAFSEEENKRLEFLLDQGRANGIQRLSIISGNAARALEPNLSADITAALLAETSGIVCPFRLTHHAVQNAAQNGLILLRGSAVTGVSKGPDGFLTTAGAFLVKSRFVINAAGVGADKIAAMAGDAGFSITPRKGEYMLYDKSAGGTVSRTIFQIPTGMGKGVLVTPTVDGNLLIGPSAENMTDRENKDTTAEGLDGVFRMARKSVPSLKSRDVITSFTGLRAVSDTDDFIVGPSESCENWINLAGIQSPGLSSAPAIAEYAASLILGLSGGVGKNPDFLPELPKSVVTSELSADELSAILAKDGAYGHIVCRCETVSEAEIISCIRGPAGAVSLDGVKRRVRAGAGRCQAGFCMPKVMEILSRELNLDLTAVNKNEDGSYILIGRKDDFGYGR